MFLLCFKWEEKKTRNWQVTVVFVNTSFFCYIQYDTSSKSIDCSVPFLYMSFLSLHIYGCNILFIFMFDFLVHFSLRMFFFCCFFRFLLCGNRLRCLLWVCQLADVLLRPVFRPHKAPGSVPSFPFKWALWPRRSLKAKKKKKKNLDRVGVIFHPVYANVPISEGHVQGSWHKGKKGSSLLFCGDRKPVAAHPLLWGR